MPDALAELFVEGGSILRQREPVTVGVPLAKGAVRDSDAVGLFDRRASRQPLQCTVLDRWPEGSVRWLLADFQADHDPADGPVSRYTLAAAPPDTAPVAAAIAITEAAGQILVHTGAAQFALRSGPFPFAQIRSAAGDLIDPDGTHLVVETDAGERLPVDVSQVAVERAGIVRTVMRLDGACGPSGRSRLEAIVRLHFHAGSAAVRCEITLRNPRRAGHAGGIWELGDEGSLLLRQASLVVSLPAGSPGVIACSPEPGLPFEPSAGALAVHQESSGGPNWQSRTHLDRQGVVPLRWQGYRLRNGEREQEGLRAQPIVSVTWADRQIAVAVPRFWQNFPKGIEVERRALSVHLFPAQEGRTHELQGGEQKTQTVYLAFDRDRVTEQPLEWTRGPALARVSATHYCETGAVAYLVPPEQDADPSYARLVGAGVAGPDTFERKREAIDEYGWRNFGDVYADHEAVFHRGPEPLISHYNNQWDGIAGFAYQFMRTTDRRWWSLFIELADHVVDIDLYHTDEDRAVYNHGLFWHTYHYVDAGLSTHRAYPRAPGVGGGGPSPEHNYARGLLLHYYLTGSEASREAVVHLARWVLAMDDGARTPARWLTRHPTGWASATAGLHRPGRGAGNSIAVLLDGHRLTSDRAFLDKAEEVIRRCVHPHDDVAADDLLNVELRWSYTVFLHALGKYLDYKAEIGEVDAAYAYARASLLTFARWMVDYESPYLDHPEKLEYPTETWAAQELWKNEVFLYAAKHAEGDERAAFLERASFFFRYAVTTLSDMETRTLARPMFLLLSHGFMQGYVERRTQSWVAPAPAGAADYGRPLRFVPQKAVAKRRLAVLAAVGAAAVLTAGAVLLF